MSVMLVYSDCMTLEIHSQVIQSRVFPYRLSNHNAKFAYIKIQID